MSSPIRRAMAAAVAELLVPRPAPTPPASAPVGRPTASTIEAHRRRRKGKRIAPLPVTQTRWLQRDVETAQHMASQGDLSRVGQLHRALRRDGVAHGLYGTRTNGLVRLPRR